ncbi:MULTISPECIES: hypothetical protein [unclassified Ruegeria]|uniref:hypothetical protein n=1 Tax=unclassified Ruegeria TaxID=2625375 RepID=UPI0014916F4B|nr:MULTISPECIES: hypothetical protein [unclassified Ruegeria]NOC44333.1 hypothetical protein [Ruegeria sp. HKCCD7559]
MLSKNLILSLTVSAFPAAMSPDFALAKPNGYPGEHSKFKPNDPAAIARQKAAQDTRQELRKQKREERRRKRLDKRANRSR